MLILFFIFATMRNLSPESWIKKLRTSYHRELKDYNDKIDFASNDYLGFAKDKRIKKIIQKHFNTLYFEGSTGSRLMSGNREFIEDIEQQIALLHNSENALIFPSAYQANVGLFSCIADRNDLYLTDENIHASIIDGIRLSYAQHYKFKHNDFEHLNKLIQRHYSKYRNIIIVTEGLYSMDGDSPDVKRILEYIDNQKNFLVVDEAHSVGIMGSNYLGLFNEKNIAQYCLARIIGYGKAFGFSGAAIVGSNALKNYLINFSRAFIFSTALPLYHYQILPHLYNELIYYSEKEHQSLQNNIHYYLDSVKDLNNFSKNNSPIQYFLIDKNDAEKIQNALLDTNLYAKVIFPPTVSENKERVRISLHSFNNPSDIRLLIGVLKTFIK